MRPRSLLVARLARADRTAGARRRGRGPSRGRHSRQRPRGGRRDPHRPGRPARRRCSRAGFPSLRGILADRFGSVFLTESVTNLVLHLDPDTQVTGIVAGPTPFSVPEEIVFYESDEEFGYPHKFLLVAEPGLLIPGVVQLDPVVGDYQIGSWVDSGISRGARVRRDEPDSVHQRHGCIPPGRLQGRSQGGPPDARTGVAQRALRDPEGRGPLARRKAIRLRPLRADRVPRQCRNFCVCPRRHESAGARRALRLSAARPV